MQIFVKTLQGETLALEVEGFHTVEDVQCMLAEKTGNCPRNMPLIFAGRQLVPHRYIISDGNGIGHESTLHMVTRLRGCEGCPLCRRDRQATVPPTRGDGVALTRQSTAAERAATAAALRATAAADHEAKADADELAAVEAQIQMLQSAKML